MNKLVETIKKLWSNRVIKTVLVTAAGGAIGAVEPMIVAGTFVLNSATIHAALLGAGAAVWALYIHKPAKQEPPNLNMGNTADKK